MSSDTPLEEPPAHHVEVLYHEGPCIVVNKPAGIATQAPRGVVGLDDLVKDYLRARENKTGNIYLGVPHRLDRPVSGAIVFARHVRAARRLSEQFQGRRVRKVYWALVEGRPGAETGTWTDYLRKVPGRAAAEIVGASNPEGCEASLHFRQQQLFSVPPGYQTVCLLEIQLITGRTHQIRVQASSHGFPVLGDEQYGATLTFGPQTSDPRGRAIALHARMLEFEHPKTRQTVCIEAPLPASWAGFSFS
jgi:23S rRNA pseudouridine1911/1915/1917 synthase